MKRIGIDLGGTKIQGIVLDEAGAVVASQRMATPSGSYDGTVRALINLVGELERTVSPPHGPATPIGIGTPGIWQPARASMKNCNSTWLNDRPLLSDLTRSLGPRVRLANDADCFALSEATAGAGAEYESVFGVILGTGVGGGLVVNGRLLRGPNGLTGEWGHTPLPYLGIPDAARAGAEADPQHDVLDGLESRLDVRRCYCGRAGCIETYLSGPGLERSYLELWDADRTSETIASGTDREARLTLSLYCRMLARSLAQIINILDPAVIVLGGGLSNVDGLYAPLNRMLADYVFSGECVTHVKPPRWGAESGVLGAARLWPERGEPTAQT